MPITDTTPGTDARVGPDERTLPTTLTGTAIGDAHIATFEGVGAEPVHLPDRVLRTVTATDNTGRCHALCSPSLWSPTPDTVGFGTAWWNPTNGAWESHQLPAPVADVAAHGLDATDVVDLFLAGGPAVMVLLTAMVNPPAGTAATPLHQALTVLRTTLDLPHPPVPALPPPP